MEYLIHLKSFYENHSSGDTIECTQYATIVDGVYIQGVMFKHEAKGIEGFVPMNEVSLIITKQ